MGVVSDTWKDIFFKDERLVNLKQLAKENKCPFTLSQKFNDQPLVLKSFKAFTGNKAKRFRGIITSNEKEIPCIGRMYDFINYEGRKKKVTTIIEINSPKLKVHPFKIVPKGKMNKFKEIFLREEQEFLLADEFYNDYQLIYDREKNIKLNLNDIVLKLITSRNHLTIEGDGTYLLVYYKNHTIPATELKAEFAFAIQLLQEIIEHQTLMEI